MWYLLQLPLSILQVAEWKKQKSPCYALTRKIKSLSHNAKGEEMPLLTHCCLNILIHMPLNAESDLGLQCLKQKKDNNNKQVVFFYFLVHKSISLSVKLS